MLWWSRRGSNSQSPTCKAGAFPIVLRPQNLYYMCQEKSITLSWRKESRVERSRALCLVRVQTGCHRQLACLSFVAWCLSKGSNLRRWFLRPVCLPISPDRHLYCHHGATVEALGRDFSPMLAQSGNSFIGLWGWSLFFTVIVLF
jgi:hypothetical protein